MQSMKNLGSMICRTGLVAVGGMLMLTAMSGTAMAIDPPAGQVPEINPGSIVSAITLLTGSVMVLTGRRLGK